MSALPGMTAAIVFDPVLPIGAIVALAVVLGTFTVMNYLRIGALLSATKKYTLTILRKEADGRWRLARDANLVTEVRSSA